MAEIVPPDQILQARKLRSLIAAREENRDLVLMGAYRAGSDPQLDRALDLAPLSDAFLQQERGECVSLADSFAALDKVVQHEA